MKPSLSSRVENRRAPIGTEQLVTSFAVPQGDANPRKDTLQTYCFLQRCAMKHRGRLLFTPQEVLFFCDQLKLRALFDPSARNPCRMLKRGCVRVPLRLTLSDLGPALFSPFA